MKESSKNKSSEYGMHLKNREVLSIIFYEESNDSSTRTFLICVTIQLSYPIFCSLHNQQKHDRNKCSRVPQTCPQESGS